MKLRSGRKGVAGRLGRWRGLGCVLQEEALRKASPPSTLLPPGHEHDDEGGREALAGVWEGPSVGPMQKLRVALFSVPAPLLYEVSSRLALASFWWRTVSSVPLLRTVDQVPCMMLDNRGLVTGHFPGSTRGLAHRQCPLRAH